MAHLGLDFSNNKFEVEKESLIFLRGAFKNLRNLRYLELDLSFN